jgi:molecular chaperone GrpE
LALARKHEKTASAEKPEEKMEQNVNQPEEAVNMESDKDVTDRGEGDTDPVGILEEKLKAAEEASKQAYDRMLRAAAEHENHKKRIERENQEFRKFANESLIKDLLPVIDNLERAVESSGTGHATGDAIVEGVKMTLKEIHKVLERFHLKPLESEGKPFDPNFHQAVLQQETAEHPENVVLKEMQKGYILHDRLIRPAMVVVSKATANNGDGQAESAQAGE